MWGTHLLPHAVAETPDPRRATVNPPRTLGTSPVCRGCAPLTSWWQERRLPEQLCSTHTCKRACTCVHTHTWIHTNMCVHTRAHIHMSTHVCRHVHTRREHAYMIHTFTEIHEHMHAHTYTCTKHHTDACSVHTWIHMCTRGYTRAHTYTYMYTHVPHTDACTKHTRTWRTQRHTCARTTQPYFLRQ